MAVAGFEQLLNYMAQADFFTGILPFLLSYIVFFLALKKVPIMDQADNKNFRALLAIIFAFFVANFLVSNPVYQSFFSAYFGRLAIGMIGIFGFMALLAFLPGVKLDNLGTVPVLAFVAVLIVIASFTLAGGTSVYLPGVEFTLPMVGVTLGEVINFTMQSGLIWLLVIAGALYWVTSDDSGSNTDYTGGAKWALTPKSWPIGEDEDT